ncbi:Bax inhibitor-1/YccA family protein [Commensalibacter papalotli (ex Botero et al. 2024)]|uniref:Bax inhibitor (BI-1)/TMBIM family (YbhL) (PDB:4PGR) (PUBMED:28064000) n=1 Tax=Commensalibacter papalotli (ex Botero et al. 2024) TaxID=2972766 RepID=A0ABM9HK30_9PROT|nr:Bax inhibitor-1/YccA family protein [Commensalibacter papalotli (ex Botero et al. 2024)]CAI3924043.1 Bax inhibitor (BI-1)/TMBIM family (YbhL) (PDB:4PGR) (PUBMED:28064000) [Commensalibacter papalotli (ex Botero et al. 2024)]CAI3927986.1 Bax inhibitor (BI-1)/TMBIM family (YbhL) (PDB:4PGR) (PUBMED:28064000) [Commensalibacter papalotli (ex Botero et al. 2024)]
MAFRPNSYNDTSQHVDAQVAFDAGLRSYMLRVYNWMASGLLLTALVSYLVANSSLGSLFYKIGSVNGVVTTAPTTLGFIAILSPLAFILVMSFGINRLSTQAAQALFWAFCAVMGISMANIFFVYTSGSITQTFLVAASMFAGMSLWGYTTNRDLTRLGSFLGMGLFGLVIAMVINIFMHSSGMSFLISLVGVVVFTGLAATDTQRIKLSYQTFYQYEGAEMAAKHSVFDALTLYLNFINLFQFLLQFMGVRAGSDN